MNIKQDIYVIVGHHCLRTTTSLDPESHPAGQRSVRQAICQEQISVSSQRLLSAEWPETPGCWRYDRDWWKGKGIYVIGIIRMMSYERHHGPFARYVKLQVSHAPGMFSPPLRVSDPDMHHGTCVAHVPWCMPGSLTSGFLWSRWRGKRSRHSRHMRNPQFHVSGKRPMSHITGNFAVWSTIISV